jgi:tetratricopeptide (TPR) repeat protein
MVCSYCQTRNTPTAVICSHCGIILRLQHTEGRAPRSRVSRSVVIRWLIIAAAAIVSGGVGWYLVHISESAHIKPAVGAVVGALAGGILLYLVSGARVLSLTLINKNKLNAVNGRMRHVLSNAEEKYEKELDNKNGTASQARLRLAIAHLLQDEVEKSVHEFQQAGRMGINESIFFNNAGVALAKRGNITQSVEMFQKAVAQNGHKGQPHVNLAHAYLQAFADEEQLLIDRALEEIDESVKVDGEKPVHFNRRGLVMLRAKRYDDAIQCFRKAMDLDATSKYTLADSHNDIGFAQFAKGDLRNAVMQFQMALRNDPGHGRALSNLGIMQLLQGQQSEALETIRNAARLDPNSAPVRNNLGYALARGRTVNDGLREFREAILHDPGFFEAYYNMGKIYLDEQILETAERNLNRAYQLNPKAWEVLVAVAVMRMQQEHWNQAMQLLIQANEIAPNQPLILNNLATCMAMDGDYSRAQDLLEKATEIDSNNADLHSQLGWVYLLQENVSMCANEMNVAININPRVARYHNNYGLCQIGRGDYDGAVGSFRKAIELDSEYGKVHYHIGYVYAVQGKQDMAIKEWEITERVEPTFVDVHVNLGVAYFKKGNYDQAINEFKKVIAVRQHRMEDFSNLGLALAKYGVFIRKGARNREDPKWKESTERHKLAIDMFDRALALDPNNVMLHSNRGLACFFANRAEDAVMEWGLVTKLDPGYARRREKVMQTEFDESAIAFAQLDILERADRVPARTADFLYRLSPGYDTEEWSVIIDDQNLSEVPALAQRSRQLERTLKALRIE